MHFIKVICSLILGCSAPIGTLATQSAKLARYTYTEYHMGVDARLVVYASSESLAQEACAAAFGRIAELDSIMSDYRRDSELTKLCEQAGKGPVRISADLYKVLSRAQELSKRSHGAFDVTVGPLVLLWRVARKSKELPSPVELETARKLVGWKYLRLDAKQHTAELTKPGMKLDLGGIAKGYADDEAQRVLRGHGIQSALVEMGGDIVVSQAPPGMKGWVIEIPNAGNAQLALANQAISTSGDTEQFVEIGGKRYSHVIDPRTGWAVTNRVQATVIARDGLTSDPLSKVFALLDAPSAKKLLRAYGVKKSYVKVAKD